MSLRNAAAEDGNEFDISVCIATFRRPKMLQRLLESLRSMYATDRFTYEIVVVDNDRDQTAKVTVEQAQCLMPNLRYFVEPKQNISHARNCAVMHARGRWVAFVDDDEIVQSDWLLAYWRQTQKQTGDGFFGPMIPQASHAVPAWLDLETFYGFPRHDSGTVMPQNELRTTNAMLRRELLLAEPFDPAFGLTGGEDLELFGRLEAQGKQFFWCDDARTLEYFPPQRTRLAWILHRGFRGGFTHSLVKKELGAKSWWVVRLGILLKACVATMVCCLVLPVELFRGKTKFYSRLVRIAVQFGHIWAVFNGKYEEYKALP